VTGLVSFICTFNELSLSFVRSLSVFPAQASLVMPVILKIFIHHNNGSIRKNKLI